MTAQAAALPYEVMAEPEAQAFAKRLTQAGRALFEHEQRAPGELLAQVLTADEYRYLNNYAEQHRHDLRQPRVAQALLTQARQALDQLPRLTIQIAAPLRYTYQQQVLAWLAEYGPGPARITFTINTSLIAGLVIEYDGHVYDYSLRTQLKRAKLPKSS